LHTHFERHRASGAGWLRAAVLLAPDGGRVVMVGAVAVVALVVLESLERR
jgi:hypothetical protein